MVTQDAHSPHRPNHPPAHHMPRTCGRERAEMCANGHRFGRRQPHSSQQRLLAAGLSAGGTARARGGGSGRGEGWRHGSGRPRERIRPSVRAATSTPRHGRDRWPRLRWLLAAMATAAAAEGPGGSCPVVGEAPCAPPGGAQWLDRPHTGRGPPAVAACGASGQRRQPPRGAGSGNRPVMHDCLEIGGWAKNIGFVAVFGRVFWRWLKH